MTPAPSREQPSKEEIKAFLKLTEGMLALWIGHGGSADASCTTVYNWLKSLAEGEGE